ncbi:MAG TPA: nuclear transport factor 2 family protein [Thermoanaerobaculia bacterium]|nr:nuclear transport factor 2 family protein [Thermoanaerobaculia bacterium]
MRCAAGISVLAAALLVLFAAGAVADETAALIELDKKWGEAGTKGDTAAVADLFADDLVSVFEGGVRGKQEELADNEPAPAGAKYEPTDYRVKFLDADTAIMTHGTKGENAHYSLHVWSRKGGAWKVIATATTPAEAE